MLVSALGFKDNAKVNAAKYISDTKVGKWKIVFYIVGLLRVPVNWETKKKKRKETKRNGKIKKRKENKEKSNEKKRKKKRNVEKQKQNSENRNETKEKERKKSKETKRNEKYGSS